MSASLVGSEMCIRDSQSGQSAPRAERALWGPERSEPSGAQNGRRQRTPVSYTHLTLPTICSV
eukprot:5845291-Alexandrium_andersonii.AAC.1